MKKECKNFIGVSTIIICGMLYLIPHGFKSESFASAESDKVLEQFSREISNCGFDYKHINVKSISDINDNPYLVGEDKSGVGYIIYNVSDDIVAEYSYSSISPYIGYNENLYYGGPAHYFIKIENRYVSLLDVSEQYEINNVEKVDICTVNNNGHLEKEELYNSSLRSSSNFNVYGADYFYSSYCADNFGYFKVSDDGDCGYVALGLIVGYFDRNYDDNFMDNSYYYIFAGQYRHGLKNSNSSTNTQSIGEYLYNLNPKNGTISTDIKKTMEIYADERGLSINHHSLWAPFYNKSILSSAIAMGSPLELFGRFNYTSNNGTNNNTGNHAIVAYGVTDYNSNTLSFKGFRCHLGWKGYNDVIVNDYVIGSVYYFTRN